MRRIGFELVFSLLIITGMIVGYVALPSPAPRVIYQYEPCFGGGGNPGPPVTRSVRTRSEDVARVDAR